MKIKTFIKGGNFSQYQHFVIMVRSQYGLEPLGGGSPKDIAKRFGEYKIERVAIFQNIVRVEV